MTRFAAIRKLPPAAATGAGAGAGAAGGASAGAAAGPGAPARPAAPDPSQPESVRVGLEFKAGQAEENEGEWEEERKIVGKREG
jgi:hypothetical protein